MRGPIFLYPNQHLSFLSFLKITTILVDVKWYVIVVLIYISLVTRDIDIFAYAFSPLSFLEKGVLCMFWILDLYQTSNCKYFIPSCRLYFHCLRSIITYVQSFHFDKLPVFSLVAFAFDVIT